MVIAPRAESFAEALEMTAEVYHAAGRIMAERGLLQGVADEGGWWPAFSSNEEALDTLMLAIERAGFAPGEDVAISLDVAASEFGRDGRYRLGLEKRELDRDGLAELLLGWCDALSDPVDRGPFRRGRRRGFQRFTAAVGDRIQIDRRRLARDQRHAGQRGGARASRQRGADQGQSGRHGQRRQGGLRRRPPRRFGTIVSARSGETEDVSIAHLAVGWGAGQLKVGSFSRSERMAKWNEALRIEEALGNKARFAALDALPAARMGRRDGAG